MPLILALATGCTPAVVPAIPTPTPAVPQPDPRPEPPSPPTWQAPDPSVRLVDLPPADWPALCQVTFGPQSAIDLSCDGVPVPVPELDAFEALQACVARYGNASAHPDCTATVGDLAAVATEPITCSTLLEPSAAERKVRTCVDEPFRATPMTCSELVASSPVDGDPATFPTASIRLTTDPVDASTQVALFTDAGAEVPGSGVQVGPTFVWTPHRDLLDETGYRAMVRWCAGFRKDEIGFTTLAFGAPVDADALVGRAFVLDLWDADVTWVEPPVLRSLFLTLLSGSPMVGVAATDESVLTLRTGTTLGSSDSQDVCMPTEDLPVDFVGNPALAGLPIALRMEGAAFGPLEAEVVFSADGQSGVATLSGLADTRPMVPSMVPGGDEDAVCQLFQAMGATCMPCPDGQPFCIPVQLEDVPLERTSSLLVERPEDVVVDDPTCD